MKFYNRTLELKELRLIYSQSQNMALMTVITGRRRVGKTMLALEFAKGHKHLYFFVSKKAEHLLAESRRNLICIGSIHSLMYKIFEQAKEPLFGRADRIFRLRPFTIRDIHSVISDHGRVDAKTLFNLYLFTGGLPKYLDILTANTNLTFEDMLDFMLTEHSPFLHEGRTLLVEEFGKEYGSYWEKGNKNEIDLVAINDLKKSITIADIKLSSSRIDLDARLKPRPTCCGRFRLVA